MNRTQDEHDTNIAKTEEFLKEILAIPTGGVHGVPDCYGTGIFAALLLYWVCIKYVLSSQVTP
jgi:hypothetical protein